MKIALKWPWQNFQTSHNFFANTRHQTRRFILIDNVFKWKILVIPKFPLFTRKYRHKETTCLSTHSGFQSNSIGLYFCLEVIDLDHWWICHTNTLRFGSIHGIPTLQSVHTDIPPERLWFVLAVRRRGLKLSHERASELLCAKEKLRGRKEGGTMPRAPSHWGAPKSPYNVASMLLFSMQYIYSQKTLVWNTRAPNLLLAPGAI